MPQHAATNGNHARIHRRHRSSRSAETDIVQFFCGVIGRLPVFRLPGFCTGKLSGRSFRPHIGCGNHLGPRAALPQGSRVQHGNDALASLRAGVPAEFTDAAERPIPGRYPVLCWRRPPRKAESISHGVQPFTPSRRATHSDKWQAASASCMIRIRPRRISARQARVGAIRPRSATAPEPRPIP